MTSIRRKYLLAAAATLLVAWPSAPVAHAADYAGTVLSLNPLGYWRLNDAGTLQAAPTVANSGSLGAAGTGYGVLDAVIGEPGIVGNALRVSNTGWTVGYCGSKVDIPWNPQLNPNGSYTVEFWAKPSSPATDLFCPISSLSPDAGPNARAGWLFYQTAANQWLFRVGGLNSYAGLAEGGVAQAGAWNHVVGVYDAPTATVTLYVNGQHAAGPAPATSGTGFAPNPNRAFRLGGTGFNGNLGTYAGNRGYDGWLDEVAFYNGVLSPERIAAHYDTALNNNANYGAAVLADNPVGYWRLDEPAYTPPDPGTYPVAANAGSLGASANGRYQPGAAPAADGPPFSGLGGDNHAANLNGVAGQISVPDVADLDLSGPLTLMAWVKPTSSATLRYILAHGPADAEVFLRINAGSYEVGAWDGVNTSVASAAVPAGDVGNWVFLAGAWDGTAWKLYRYGKLIASDANGYGPLPVNAEWAIGARGKEPDIAFPGADGRFFGGGVDEVAIFGTALTEAQIQSVYAAANVSPIILVGLRPPSGGVYAGDTVSFEVIAEGPAPLSYRWTKDGTPLAGQTASTLTLASVSGTDSGTYVVEVTNANGTATSSVELTVITTPPSITQQPRSASRYAGATIALTVVAEGSSPLTYEWKRDGNALAGATDATLVLANVTAANAGTYTCTITNPYGQSTTDPATVTVLPVPAGYAGVVLRDEPLAYWRLGETSGPVGADHWGGWDGQYRAANLGQPGFSALDPDTAVAFNGENSSLGGISGTGVDFTGANTTFSLEAWVKGEPSQLDGAGIIAKGSGTDGGTGDEQFCLDVTSGVYHFFIRKASDNAVVEVSASSGPNGSWQHLVAVYGGAGGLIDLYVDGVPANSISAPGDTGPRTSTHPVSIGARRGGVDPNYDLFFNGTIDEVAIYDKALTADRVLAHFEAQYGANQAPLIQVQPVSVTTFVGLPAKLSVAAAGTQPLSFQWKKNGADVPGAVEASLSLAQVAASDAGTYTVVVTNPVGTLTSEPATLTVLPAPTADVAVPNLVAHWKFENNLTDDTGRGNNGTAAGTLPLTYVDGKIGSRALQYRTDASDTANVLSSYVDLGVRPDLQFGTSDFSLAFWVRLPLNYAFGDLPFFGNALNSANNPGYTFAPSYGTSVAGGWGWSLFSVGGGGGINVYGEIGSINDGEWHHLVHSFDREGAGVTYLDGVPVDSRLVTTIGNLDTGRPTSIGQDPSGTYPETGQADLDDFGVFRKALTPLEAASIYVAGRNGHSFVNAPPTEPNTRIKMADGGQVTIEWDNGAPLQEASAVTGPYTDIPGAKSPYTTPASGAARFFRVP